MNDQIKINWYRCKVDRDVMSRLMRRSDARAFAQVLPQLGLYIVTGTLAYTLYRQLGTGNWPWMLPLLLLTLFAHGTNASFFGGCACHELCHKTPFATQAWNTFSLRVYAFLSWFDPVGYRASHVRHHQATTHADHDGEVVLPQSLNWQSVRFFVTALTFDPAALWKLFRFWVAAARGDLSRDGFFKSQWLQRVVPDTDTKSRRELVTWARVVLFGHLALAATFIATGHWFLVVIVNFGCLYSGWLGILTGMPQHIGLSPNTPDFRLCCRTYTCSWLPAFFYWNMQYHVEHHMFPAVPFYNLPRLRQAIAHDLPPATHGLWATWRDDILPVVRRQREDPAYVYVPPLPQNEGDRATDTQVLSEAAQS
ncbi:MAG: fatty acid desaturase [Opitutae bacterium]|nr:fatty acid desaturase [Opitutae bacterium]